MKVTQKNIILMIEKATGLTPDIEKYENEYYWCGKEASLFDERCTHFSTLTHPNITIDSFVDDFIRRVKKVEAEYGESITDIVNSIDWSVDYEN